MVASRGNKHNGRGLPCHSSTLPPPQASLAGRRYYPVPNRQTLRRHTRILRPHSTPSFLLHRRDTPHPFERIFCPRSAPRFYSTEEALRTHSIGYSSLALPSRFYSIEEVPCTHSMGYSALAPSSLFSPSEEVPCTYSSGYSALAPSSLSYSTEEVLHTNSGEYFALAPQPYLHRGIIQVRCPALSDYGSHSEKRRASIESILYRRSSLYLLINYCLLSRLSLWSLFCLRSRLAHNLEWKFYGYFLVEAYYRCMST